MNKDQCFYLGSVAKFHGYKGEVALFLDVDYPDEYSELESVFVEINKQLVPFFIEHSRRSGKNMLVVRFEDTSSQEDVEHLLKKDLYLPLTILPKLQGNQFYYHEIKGFSVVDERLGNVGTIKEVFDHPTNPLFIIEDGEKETIIPINDDFLTEVNRDKSTIFVNTPEGLIEANW